MKADVRITWRLLKPLARPHLFGFLLVLALGAMAAVGERSVFLLLSPTFEALFPTEKSVEVFDVRGGADTIGRATGAPVGEMVGGAVGAAAGEVVARASSEAVVVAHATGEGVAAVLQRARVPAVSESEPGLFAWVHELRLEAVEFLLGTAHPVTIDERQGLLWRVALVVVLIAMFTGICHYSFTWVSRKIALRIVVDLRMRLARHLMGLSMRYHDSRHLGDLLSRVSVDVNTTLQVLNDSFRNLIQEPLLAIASLAMAAWISPMATLILVVGLPTVVLPVTLLAKKVRKGSTRSLTKLGASVQVLSQMFQGIRTVKAFRAEERELERFQEINEEYVGSTMKMVRAIALTNSWTILFTHAGLGGLIVAVGWLTLSGNTGFNEPGDMVAYFVLIANVYTNIKKTTRMWTRVEESVGATIRLQSLLDEPTDLVERPGAVELHGLGSGLRLEGVSFSYPEGEGRALDSIDLAIRPGETLALVGASGAGKSTLVDLIARFRDPCEGAVTVDGHDLRELTLDSWTAQYAMVSQTPFLFHATVEENIGYGRPGATQTEVEAAATAAGIHEFIEGLPEGYATGVADMGARLSGGQRQRITIARAILKGAPLLLLDEATSALDTETEVLVQAALDRLMSGRTVVVIAHRLSTIRSADRIAVLEGGRLVELGSHEELLERDGVYARLHAAQFEESPAAG